MCLCTYLTYFPWDLATYQRSSTAAVEWGIFSGVMEEWLTSKWLEHTGWIEGIQVRNLTQSDFFTKSSKLRKFEQKELGRNLATTKSQERRGAGTWVPAKVGQMWAIPMQVSQDMVGTFIRPDGGASGRPSIEVSYTHKGNWAKG
jgi:hypothetical protein